MDSNNKKIRKFVNKNIINVDKETLDSDLYKESVMTEFIKVNGSTDYVTANYDLRVILVPSSGYQLAKESLIPPYKLLKHSKNFSKIKRVFLIGYSHLSIKQSIFLSAYNYYESHDSKKLFEVDQSVYADILKNEILKKIVEKFELNSYTSTLLIDNNGTLTEKEEEFNENVEDNEYTFDTHLSFINHLFENKVRIVPIWINLNNSNLPNLKEVLFELGNFLNSFLSNEENFFIYSSNLTYFGRLYNYFGDGKSENKEYKTKSFLRDPNNEEKAKSFIKSGDDEGINAIVRKDIDGLLRISNFNYCKKLFASLIHLVKNEMKCEQLGYQIKLNENKEEGYECNLVSFSNLIFYYLKN